MNPTSIAWVLGPDGNPGYSWNPFAGCSEPPASAGCSRCYAKRLASTRLAHLPAYKGLTKIVESLDEMERDHRWTGEVRFFPEKLAEPLKRKKPAGIFVGDMGDIALLTFEQIAAIFGVMAACPQHRFYVLTKRPERLRTWFEGLALMAGDPWTNCHWEALATELDADDDPIHRLSGGDAGRPWPLPNVFVGASVCTQEDADRSIPELLQIPAAVRFLSCEPLLERVCVSDIVNRSGAVFKPLAGLNWVPTARGMELSPKAVGPRLSWVIVGGESGSKARPCDAAWIRSIVQQCAAAGTACFVKQLGAFPRFEAGVDSVGKSLICPNRVSPNDDPSEWPADLRVRQMPEVKPCR